MKGGEVEKDIPRNSNQNKPREENGKENRVVFKWKYRHKRLIVKNTGYRDKFKPLTLASYVVLCMLSLFSYTRRGHKSTYHKRQLQGKINNTCKALKSAIHTVNPQQMSAITYY